jgi:hypothetical protein
MYAACIRLIAAGNVNRTRGYEAIGFGVTMNISRACQLSSVIVFASADELEGRSQCKDEYGQMRREQINILIRSIFSELMPIGHVVRSLMQKKKVI